MYMVNVCHASIRGDYAGLKVGRGWDQYNCIWFTAQRIERPEINDHEHPLHVAPGLII